MTCGCNGQPLSAEEFGWWMAYESLEPFGEMRADLRAGRICEIMVKMWGSRRSANCKPEDFVVFPGAKRQEKQSVESMLAAAIVIAKSTGGTVSEDLLDGCNAGRFSRQTDGE